MSAAAINLTGLRAGFGDGRPVLKGVDLRVEAGEVVALVGANGAGKTTLLRSLVGLVPIQDGTLAVDGVSVPDASRGELRALRCRVGFAFQRSALAPRLTVLHNVLHGGLGRNGVRGWSPATVPESERQLAVRCLDRVGLRVTARQRLGALSGGQQQRVMLARALMQRPRILLADEPVASLDPTAAQQIMRLMVEIAADEGITVVTALHQIDYAQRFTDRIVGLSAGRVTLDRPAKQCEVPDLNELYAAVA